MTTPPVDDAMARGRVHQPRPTNAFTPFATDAIEQSIGDRFEEQVRRYPDRLAVKSAGDGWTYAELNRNANRIAHAILAARGTGEEPVALLLEQGALLVAAILGVLKAGKVYVPLDPTSPRARLAELRADSAAALIVAAASSRLLATELAPAGAPVLDASSLDEGLSREDPGVPVSPDAGAYIYYTSGSTGRPKGVLDTHRNVLHNIMRYTNSLHIAADDRLTLLQGPSFSGAVSSLFAALLNGAASFPFDVGKEGVGRIAPWLRREAITIYHSVPALFRHVAAGGESFPALRLIRLEGDGASVKDVELYRRHFAATSILVHGLGATECGIVRQYFVGPETRVPDTAVPIGYPVEGMEVLVLDETGRETGPRTVGEIAVRSRYLARGYWRRPDLTEAAFAPDAGSGGFRVYRTGDLGRMDADGCLEHLGRKDFQSKIRGQRVDTADVEAALLSVHGVKDAVVATRQNAAGEARLVAYIVPTSRPVPTVSAIRRHLTARLPDFMIPSAYVVLDALPLNDNAKVDRRALPAPGPGRPELDPVFVAPQNLLQLELARIWEELLGVRPVGVRDDFFEIGGDSLLAVCMMVEVERALGRKIPPSVMLSGSTIEHVAGAIQVEATDLLAPVVAIQAGGSEPPFFFLHGDYLSGGFFTRSLARHLGEDQPIYALPPCGLDGGPVPPSYEAMAARHVEAMRSVQPRGPYRLGGLCNGGLVAFEVARLLEREGQKVDLLVPIAASVVNARFGWLRRLTRCLAAARGDGPVDELEHFARLRDTVLALERLPPRARVRRVLSIMARIPGRLRLRPTAVGRGSVVSMPSPESRAPAPPDDTRRRLREAYLRLDDLYSPGTYGGRVILLWPSEDPVPPHEAARCWRRVAREVSVRVVPGSHITCLTTHVESAAGELRRCLQERATV